MKGWKLLVVKQAGSRDPVRRCVVEIDGSLGSCGPLAGRAGMAVFGRTLSRWVYPETTRVGDCFGSLGPAALDGRQSRRGRIRTGWHHT